MNRNDDVIAFIVLRRPRVANFSDIIKVGTMFIKITFKNLKKS